MKKTSKKELFAVADMLFEVGVLAKTPRSGFFFLGSGKQSVAEHLHRVSCIGFALGHLAGDVDVGRVVQMCVFHDISESRISDLNYVHQKYTERFEEKAHKDITDPLPFGDALQSLVDEYEDRESKESLLAKDADNLELIISLKEQYDIGNERAKTWFNAVVSRLKTEEAIMLVDKILKTDSDHWWFAEKDSDWWVNRRDNDTA